jgi:hypothetical protein
MKPTVLVAPALLLAAFHESAEERGSQIALRTPFAVPGTTR